MTDVRFAVLGPVRAWRRDTELDLGSRQQRLVLALLLARPNRPVSTSELLDLLWDDEPPRSAVNIVHRYIGTLRRVLEPDLALRANGEWLFGRGSEYRLRADAQTSDLVRCRQLTDDARKATARGQADVAMTQFAKALELWQGQCAAGLEPASGVHPAFVAVDREYSAIAHDAAEAALRYGSIGKILPGVRQAAERNPLDEPLQSQLILLLAADGKQAEALATYEHVRHRLADELGVEPSRELRSAHERVLRQHIGADDAAPPAPRFLKPAQLPADLAAFTGRADTLDRAAAMVSASTDATTIVAVDGMPGIGKTAFALRLAHLSTPQFPDGQLYIDLRGYGPPQSMVGPGEALRRFLNALGVPQNDIPTDLADQAALYRSVMADRRILVVLDNARSIEQIQDLLPGSATALVIVTSRGTLLDLVTRNGAHRITLGVLTAPEARAALARRVGTDRVAAEPEAMEKIIQQCGRLPLALAIAAAGIVSHPGSSLADIAHELDHAPDALDGLDGLGPSQGARPGLRGVFSWSYDALSPAAARLFRLLSVHPGPDIALGAIASLGGLTASSARALTGELALAHMVTERRLGRFIVHDLISAYATELCREVDTDDERRAALYRCFDHYRHSSHAANLRLLPLMPPPEPEPARPGVTAETFPDAIRAMAWFDAECHVLNTVVRHAAQQGAEPVAWPLALTLQQFYQRMGRYHDWAATMGCALEAAERIGDVTGQAHSHRSLSGAFLKLGEHDRHRRHLEAARALYEQLGWSAEQAYVHSNLADGLFMRGRFTESLASDERAFALFKQTSHNKGMAGSLYGQAACLIAMGRLDESIGPTYESMRLFQELGDANGEGLVWNILAEAYQRRGDHHEAAQCRRRGIDLYRKVDSRFNAAEAFIRLGLTGMATGDYRSVRECLTQALELLDDRVDES
ncbi:BTAD domain-containing putative transcriptional regulator [Dactylosporangium salmoneum]|uniref:BTAD domain-containing putative transcriptional regulator n=2 Tax=Dactylosporangium salmoneum TaxID=53361 RepID=A0ABP5UV60_9ACTN